MPKMPHTFDDPAGQRGAAVVSIPMHELYKIIHDRLLYAHVKGDIDAICQKIGVEIEKNQGTFPNHGVNPDEYLES